jgi:hypothetical protein
VCNAHTICTKLRLFAAVLNLCALLAVRDNCRRAITESSPAKNTEAFLGLAAFGDSLLFAELVAVLFCFPVFVAT